MAKASPSWPKLAPDHPKVAQAVFNGFGASMMHSSLSQPFFAWIRYLVAHNSDCTFCIDVNAGMLLQMGASQENLQDALEDATTAPLPEKEKALLSACIQVIRDRCTLQKEEIDHLKRLGNTDTELVAAFHHAAHSQAADMMINAFGL